jgi:hypothetical protein
MARKKIIRSCTDRILDLDQMIARAERAMAENPLNAPLAPLGAPEMPPGLPGGISGPQQLALLTSSKWQPGRSLRVRFMDGHPTVQAKVEQIAHMWEQYANIKFVFGSDPEAEIRIAFTPGAGSWSYLGVDALGIPKDRPTMNYGWLTLTSANEEYHRVVLHEFGHALGCIHEHQHPQVSIPWNKPAVYRYYGGPPNNWSPAQVDAQLFARYSVDQTQFSEFDRQSIMLYPVPKELTDGTYEVGWNRALSDLDKQYIGVAYPFEPKDYVELALGAAPLDASIGVHGEEDLYRFVVAAAGTYTIETAGRTDVQMGLYGPDDRTRQIAYDDDSGAGLNPKISAVLQPGKYYVRVRHYRPKGTGKYTITLKA